MVQRPRLWGQNQEPAVHHRQGNLRGPGGLRGDPPTQPGLCRPREQAPSHALQARHPTRPLDPVHDRPQLCHHHCWWCSLPRSPTSWADRVVTGQQGLWWFCSHLNFWSWRLSAGECKVARRKSDRWSNVGTDFPWVPSSGFPSSFTDGPYHRRRVVMEWVHWSYPTLMSCLTGKNFRALDSRWLVTSTGALLVFQVSPEMHNLLLQHATDYSSFVRTNQGSLDGFFS